MFSKRYFDSFLKLKDGVRLISRIWLPEGSGPWPALLMRQPYGREIASSITYAHPSWWASKGYMVIIQDVRGQGESEGIFEGFNQEANDTSETHQWVRSLNECNGKLGLYGFSYQGLTQLTGNESSIPPDCLTPAMTGLDIKSHWCSDGGAFWWGNNITWAMQIAALKMKRENNKIGWEKIRSSLENQTFLRDGFEILKKYDPNNFIIKWNEILNNDEDFKIIRPVSSWLKKPILIYGGLWDPHLSGALDLYKKSKDLGGNPEIIISDSSHLHWWDESQITLLKFFDKYLKDNEISKLNNISHKKIWNISLKSWENIENTSLNYEFYLGSEGKANFEIEDGSLAINSKSTGFFTIVHDPWRPVILDGGHLGKNPGIFDRKCLDKRLDVGVFQTHFLKENIHISGIPTLRISLISDQESFDICAALSIIENDEKKVNQFSTGFLRVKKAIINNEASYEVKFHPTNITLLKGCKLRLSIAASAWPAIGVNPGHSDSNFTYVSIDHKIITLNFNLKNAIMKIAPFFK
tara:strand:- start:2032 stop:3603 length:1572 start_codon:yes stop_codon:yes gene_type:complete